MKVKFLILNRLKFIFMLFLFLSLHQGQKLHAQSRHEVSGQIIGLEDKLSVPGANVIEKGTQNGVSADFDGNFTIRLSSENATIVVSSVGLQTQEIQVKGQKNHQC